jgi:hypothetical protein
MSPLVDAVTREGSFPNPMLKSNRRATEGERFAAPPFSSSSRWYPAVALSASSCCLTRIYSVLFNGLHGFDLGLFAVGAVFGGIRTVTHTDLLVFDVFDAFVAVEH